MRLLFCRSTCRSLIKVALCVVKWFIHSFMKFVAFWEVASDELANNSNNNLVENQFVIVNRIAFVLNWRIKSSQTARALKGRKSISCGIFCWVLSRESIIVCGVCWCCNISRVKSRKEICNFPLLCRIDSLCNRLVISCDSLNVSLRKRQENCKRARLSKVTMNEQLLRGFW